MSLQIADCRAVSRQGGRCCSAVDRGRPELQIGSRTHSATTNLAAVVNIAHFRTFEPGRLLGKERSVSRQLSAAELSRAAPRKSQVRRPQRAPRVGAVSFVPDSKNPCTGTGREAPVQGSGLGLGGINAPPIYRSQRRTSGQKSSPARCGLGRSKMANRRYLPKNLSGLSHRDESVFERSGYRFA
jgi:hypothetical protein